jgi:cytochrome b
MPKLAKTEPDVIALPDAAVSHETVRVWDLVTRLFHWSLVTSIALALLTRHRSDFLHFWPGYAALALVVFRVVWGLVGPRYARFSHFVRPPGTILSYLASIGRGTETRHIGHNPAGGAMVVVLLIGIVATSVTGWMETTDAYFGVAWVQILHSVIAHGLVLLVAAHLAGVALASIRHRENLVRSMITGRKRPPEPDAVD